MWIIPIALHWIDKPVFSHYLPPVRFFLSLLVYLVFRPTNNRLFFFCFFVCFVFKIGFSRREAPAWASQVLVSLSAFLHTLHTIHLIARTRVFHLGGLFCSLMYYMNEDHRSYIRNFCSCEKKAGKNSGLYGIRTLDLCDTGAALWSMLGQSQTPWEKTLYLKKNEMNHGGGGGGGEGSVKLFTLCICLILL